MCDLSSPMVSPYYSLPHNYSQHQEQNEEDMEEDLQPQKREKRKYRCRRRSPATIERARTVRRDKANARERRRMNSLNDALEHLRTIIPQLPDEPKMTKIETLREAQRYIMQLSSILSSDSSSHSEVPCSAPSPSISASSSTTSSAFNSPFYPPAYPQPSSTESLFYYDHHTQQLKTNQ